MTSIVPLCKKFDPKKHDPTGWYCSIKYDGMRGLYVPLSDDGKYVNQSAFMTRTGKPIFLPDNCILFKSGAILDVEITIPGRPFREVSGIARRHNPNPEDWKGVVFRVIDCPSRGVINLPFKHRLPTLLRAIKQIENRRTPETIGTLMPVSQQIVHDRKHYEDMHHGLVRHGHEGTVLRHPNATWEAGKRLSTWLKRAARDSREAVVVGVQEGTGKYIGEMGALVCKWRPSDRSTFKVGSGFIDADRDKGESFWIGKTITISYKELGETGAPREPIYKGIRDE